MPNTIEGDSKPNYFKGLNRDESLWSLKAQELYIFERSFEI